MAGDSATRALLSVVIPAYNEAENIAPLLRRLTPVLDSLNSPWEIIFVDDGSSDATAAATAAAAAGNERIRPLRLARNFGHQVALYAGIEHARGAAVISLDADLQHPPELIPEMVRLWRDGADVVQCVRRRTAGAGAFKSLTSRAFYRILSALATVQVSPGAADFRLLSRRAAAAFLACRETARFNRGLVHWIGFERREITYDAEPRAAGRTKYSLRGMLRLAGNAIFSFSSWPLRFAGLAGAVVSLCAIAYLAFVLWAALFTTRVVPGWTSILATVLVLGGVQLIVLWIMGEYLGRTFDEVKRRPLYLLRDEPPPAPHADPDAQP